MSAFTDFEDHDAVGLAALVARGETTPEALLEAAVERVDARNETVNAVTNRLYDHGRGAIAEGLPDGPLKGVPYLLKDLGASLAGCPTTRGCKFFEDAVPAQDSELVKRLKRSGVVIFGRTNTCEFGLSLTCEPQLHGPTQNPWDYTHIPGGSSGGARLVLELPSGGGYGEPAERDPAAVAADVLDGLITMEDAERDYGFFAGTAPPTRRPPAPFDAAGAPRDRAGPWDDASFLCRTAPDQFSGQLRKVRS